MTYHTSSAQYESNPVYESNHNSKFNIIGVCRGTCYTSQGCSCR